MSAAVCISARAERAAQPHPIAQQIGQAAEKLKPLHACSPEEARKLRAERGNPYAPQACAMAAIENYTIDTGAAKIAARLYRPLDQPAGLQPVLVYYHGGGYVLGDINTYDTVTQQLAALSGCTVISIEYRVAPEVKSAAIYADGLAALQWVYNQSAMLGVDRQRIAIGGDSAGGNLTIAVALACKQSGFPQPAFQLLIYPATDYTMSFPSIKDFAQGYFLTQDNMIWFRDHFLENPERALAAQVSAMRADLHGLPPAFVLTAGFDPIRDEGYAFALRLAEHGVATEHVCYTDMIHAFISFAGGIPAGMTALTQMGQALRKALAS